MASALGRVAASSLTAARRGPNVLGVASRAAFTSGRSAVPAGTATHVDLPTDTKRADYLFNFGRASAMRTWHHYSTYVLAAGIPTGLLLGDVVNPAVDVLVGLAIPLHAHIGMRSIIIDYVPDAGQQSIALMALAGATVLLAAGLLKHNTMDDGLSHTVRSLWVQQDLAVPALSGAGKAAGKAHA